MEKTKKQFRELSEEELKNVTGGGYIQLIDFDEKLAEEMSCAEGLTETKDENGKSICVAA